MTHGEIAMNIRNKVLPALFGSDYPESAYKAEKPWSLARFRMLLYDIRWYLVGLVVACAIYAARHWFGLF